ncbi:hypothetical protein [Mycobacterium sp. AZCC_0083]|uniref:hypothetical protein n=1 Tax=Mycobacterium sp. AZCC_0083 TaxID=2735882 RepID=UPI00161C91CB|nr:hypothetical protein [Mycobacterium sp. AZCC_0083]MBB5166488.1 hypothetical protein [Mycobacterium sp. AZCC_0083]
MTTIGGVVGHASMSNSGGDGDSGDRGDAGTKPPPAPITIKHDDAFNNRHPGDVQGRPEHLGGESR